MVMVMVNGDFLNDKGDIGWAENTLFMARMEWIVRIVLKKKRIARMKHGHQHHYKESEEWLWSLI